MVIGGLTDRPMSDEVAVGVPEARRAAEGFARSPPLRGAHKLTHSKLANFPSFQICKSNYPFVGEM